MFISLGSVTNVLCQCKRCLPASPYLQDQYTGDFNFHVVHMLSVFEIKVLLCAPPGRTGS